MNEYSMAEEQEIDLLDFIKSMLEQWRGWLLAGIICMILIPSLKCLMDMRADASPEAATTATAETTTTVSYMEDVVASTNPGVALNYYVTWQQFKDLYDESLIMQLDATDIRRLTLKFFIKATEDGTDYIANYYSSLGSDKEFIVQIADSLGVEDSDMRYILDLVSVSASGSMMNDGGNLTVSVILPAGADEDSVKKAVSDYLNSLSSKIGNTIGEHSISLISSGVIAAFDEDIVKLQGNAVSNINNWKNAFLAIYKTLSDSEKKEVDGVISSLASGEISYQYVRTMYSAQTDAEIEYASSSDVQEATPVAEEVTVVHPAFSKKYAILGFVVGVFLYVGCAFAILIFIRRFRNGEEAANALQLRSYGDIYEYPYHGFLAFIHDKKIYAWRHKKTSSVEDVAKAISAKAKFGSTDKITCLVLGNAGKAGSAKIEEVIKQVSTLGIQIESKKAPAGVASLSEDEIGKFSPVLLTVVSSQTRPAQAVEVLIRLKEYNVPVFGMNFIEG